MQPDAYEFGPFRMDVASRQLLRNGRQVQITPKVFDTLAAMLERRDRLVTKEELMQAVWPDVTVEEGNLTYNISVLRKILGEDDGHPYIQTVPKRGYRVVAPLKHQAPVAGSHSQDERNLIRRRSGWIVTIAAGTLLVAAGSLVNRETSGPKPAKATVDALELVARAKEHLRRSGEAAGPKEGQGERHLARDMFETALRLSPGSAEAHAWLARTLRQEYDVGQGGRPLLDAALAHANQALSLDPDLVDARWTLIQIYHSTGQAEDGLKQAKHSIGTSAPGRHALEAAGEAYFRAGMSDRALPLFTAAIQASPLRGVDPIFETAS